MSWGSRGIYFFPKNSSFLVSRLLTTRILQKLLCTYAFPQCGSENGYQIGLPLCYEDCVAVRDLFCYNDWALVLANKEKGIFLNSRGHFALPNCDKLPKYNFDHKSPSCSYAKLTEMNKEEITCMYSIIFSTFSSSIYSIVLFPRRLSQRKR